MRRFIVSGSFFHKYKKEFLTQFPSVFSEVTAHTTVLDKKTLVSMLKLTSKAFDQQQKNLLITLQGGDASKNIQLVLRKLREIKASHEMNIILDCTLISANDTLMITQRMQYTQPVLDIRIKNFAFICNDIEMFDYLTTLSCVFRVAPMNYDKEELQRLYTRTLHQAMYFRYIHWSPVLRFMFHIYKKIRSKKNSG